MLGVMTVASGKSSFFRLSIASSLISFAPLVATITGSTTMFLRENRLMQAAIVLISSVDATIPVFTASGKISVTTASICFFRNSAETS